MFRFFRYLYFMATGRFKEAADVWQTNRYVVSGTFDRAISQSEEEFETVRNAVAKLKGIENTRIIEIKDLTQQEARLTKIQSGTQIAMQRRLDQLRAEGKSKEVILKDSEFQKHKAKFDDASSTLEQIQTRINEKEADLDGRKKESEYYKNQLIKLQENAKNLRREKQETQADMALARQQKSINDTLAGIGQNTIDKDLQEVRAARKAAIEEAKISAELAGTNLDSVEDEYLKLATSKDTSSALDDLLDWGNDKAPMEDAKLPD